jgi:ABC-type taurine transport system ATPase subunit
VTALLVCDQPRFLGAQLELGRFEAEGPLLVLVGSWAPLFQLLSGKLRLLGGSITLAGQSAEGAVASGHAGLLLRDAPFPGSWLLEDVLRHSGALLGWPGRAAARRAREVASELGLVPLLGRTYGRLRPVERRLTGLAVALLGEPALLALEEPFADLEPSARTELAASLLKALRGRPALVSVAELPGSVEQDGFVQSSRELLFAGERGLVARGSYAELAAGSGHYRLVVLRHADELCARLGPAGYQLLPRRAADGLGLLLSDLGSRGTGPLLEAALAVDAPIVELSPITLRPAPPAVSVAQRVGD